MDGSSAFRRAFHVASPGFLAYYLMPDQVGGGITRESLAVLFLGTALCIEIARIALGIRLFGMRPYEGQRVSAYAQGALALAVGIFVIQEPAIVVPVFVGMAWIDPLAAAARTHGWSRAYVAGAYFVLFLGAELALSAPWPLWAAVLFAAIATGIAVAVEGPRHAQLDDDLLMQLVPYAVLYAAAAGAAALSLW